MSQLQIEFEYHRADPRDSMSDDSLAVDEITLDGREVPLNLHDRIEMEHLASALLTALIGKLKPSEGHHAIRQTRLRNTRFQSLAGHHCQKSVSNQSVDG